MIAPALEARMTVDIDYFRSLEYPVFADGIPFFLIFAPVVANTSTTATLSGQYGPTAGISGITEITGTDLVVSNGNLVSGIVTSLRFREGPVGAETDVFAYAGLSYDVSVFGGSTIPPIYGDVPLDVDASLSTDSFFFFGGIAADIFHGSNIENLISAKAGDDTIWGGAGNDILYGDEGNDLIFAGAGDDNLQGGDGADRIFGEAGNDSIVGSGLNESFGDDDILDGGDGNDVIFGAGGNDVLVGGDGKDTIIGGDGSDWYAAQTLGPAYTLAVTINLQSLKVTGGYGKDKLDLAEGSYGRTIENAYGGSGADKLVGSVENNRLAGGKGNDTISGDKGADILGGMAGKDILTGGAGKDKFVFAHTGSKNADHITDYDSKDVIVLDKSVFAKLSLGPLASANFHVGAAAADKNDFIVYDKSSGKLFYDKDGSGHKDAVLIATIDDNVALNAHDFKVVASTADDAYWFA
jgi:Ca2+-binding RTX toxin-like protein